MIEILTTICTLFGLLFFVFVGTATLSSLMCVFTKDHDIESLLIWCWIITGLILWTVLYFVVIQ